MDNMSSLEYSIIICTYNRPDVLSLSLQNCVKQSKRPCQIIVVDASEEWILNRNRILSYLCIPKGTELLYIQAEKKSSASQRNQAIQMTHAVDILFFIDDDSYMFSDCAASILILYEKDREKKIAGIQAGLADIPPDMISENNRIISEKKRFLNHKIIKIMEKYFYSFYKYVLLMSDVQLFVPYFGSFKKNISVTINDMEYYSLNFFHGCRMSFRYELVKENLFDEDLVKYSAGEDLDISYRISQYGHLIESETAMIYHKTAAAGRLSRYKSTSMYSFDLALFIKKHSNDLKRDISRYILLSFRRFFAELLKDSLSLRFTYPQLRGVFIGSFFGMRLLFTSKMDKRIIVRYLSRY